ncbi:MAG: nucleotidyltransferase family protein [Myxococcales bacterium]|jgi:nicotine blue oxidoreductase
MAANDKRASRGLRIGVLLAAGASSRMGRPKALLEDERGQAFLARLTRTLLAGGCDALIVVAGKHVREIAANLPEKALLALNPDWEQGQLSSAKVGLRAALRLEPARIVLHLVDQPLVLATDVRRVLSAGSDVAVAGWNGEPGHPIALSPKVAKAIVSDRASLTLRDALARHFRVTTLVECSPGCLRGANTPAELEELLAGARKR